MPAFRKLVDLRFNDVTLLTFFDSARPISELKPLSKEAIPATLEKAEQYRLFNEPAEGKS